MLLKRNLPILSYLSAYKVFPPHVRRRYLCAYKAPNKTLFWSFFVAFCAFLWLKNPFNQRNPRLMNYLHAFGISTLVESALQNQTFFCKTNPISEKAK